MARLPFASTPRELVAVFGNHVRCALHIQRSNRHEIRDDGMQALDHKKVLGILHHDGIGQVIQVCEVQDPSL